MISGEADKESVRQVNKETVNSLVGQSFGELLRLGYIVSILDQHEYVRICQMPGIGYRVPWEYWGSVLNVSLIHRDFPRGPKYYYPWEFTIIDCPQIRELVLVSLALDEERQHVGEGVLMVKSLAQVADTLGFDEIKVLGPWLSKIGSKDMQPPNLLDWFAKKFPKLGADFRQKVEATGGSLALVPVRAILNPK